jgi:hypothetical protein
MITGFLGKIGKLGWPSSGRKLDAEPGLLGLVVGDGDHAVVLHDDVVGDEPAPGDAPRADPQAVALLDVVVDQRRQQVAGRSYGMDAATEVQVDFVGGKYLRG